MRHLCLMACLLFLARSETIDRLAITVGNQIITQLQIDEELRVTALLNHESAVVRNLENRRDAADRLVAQLLIKLEMQLSRYALPDTAEVDRYYQQIEEVNGGAVEFEKALRAFNLTPELLRSHLELQLTELKFIDVRFRPDANVSDADIEAAYKAKIDAWQKTHSGKPPTLDTSRESLRAMLVENRTDASLDTWLAESRKRVRLIYLDKTLQ
jgi:hypothetical protein